MSKTEKFEQLESDAALLEAAVNEVIATCDGDLRASVRSLVVANSFLSGEIERLSSLISRGFHRGKLSMLDLP